MSFYRAVDWLVVSVLLEISKSGCGYVNVWFGNADSACIGVVMFGSVCAFAVIRVRRAGEERGVCVCLSAEINKMTAWQ